MPLLVSKDERKEQIRRARGLKKLDISSREAGDLVMMGIGGFTPLTGFMDHDDWRSVCDEMHLSNGCFWPIPITLSAKSTVAADIAIHDEVCLRDPSSGEPLAIIKVNEKYKVDKNFESQRVFSTTDKDHPGVRMLFEQGDINLAGPVSVLSTSYFDKTFKDLFLSPSQTRHLFEKRGWSTVAAFQTRNPMHRSHEYLARIAIEVCDGVLIHALLGGLKPGDIPASVRSKAIDTLIENYFVKETVLHAGYPLDMRYAGPREALLHALFRQNYGCSHLLVGRDHAGVGDYYGPFDAHHIFDEIPTEALVTKPIKIDWTFWCYRCDGMASMRTCGCGPEHRLLLSGTKLRKMLSEGQEVPEKFSRPEVLSILRDYYENLSEEENVKVDLAGHSARN